MLFRKKMNPSSDASPSGNKNTISESVPSTSESVVYTVMDDDTSDDDILPVKRKRDESVEEGEKDAGVAIQQQEQCEKRLGASATLNF
jgi:hypothetical protein